MNNLKKEERITCLVPIQMFPNQNTFLELGFTFKPIPNSELLCLATLPCGWKSVINNNDALCFLQDEKNRKRGSYFYNSDSTRNSTTLLTRFYVSVIFNSDDKNSPFYIVIADRATNKITFKVGITGSLLERDRLIDKAKKILNIHYPDWKSPTAYWDD